MHWGNIGSAAAGLGTLIAAIFAVYGIVRYGPGWLNASKARQDAQAEAAREQAALAQEQAEAIRLDRRRILNGWTSNMLPVYGVTLVTNEAELAKAAQELSVVGPTDYVVLRVSESTFGNANRADSLRQLIEREHYLTRPPSPGECEALERGIKALSEGHS